MFDVFVCFVYFPRLSSICPFNYWRLYLVPFIHLLDILLDLQKKKLLKIHFNHKQASIELKKFKS